MTVASAQPRPRLALALALPIVAAGFVGFLLSDKSGLLEPLAFALIGIGVVSELMSARFTGNLAVTPAFIAGMLAVALVGPAGAFAVPLLSETVSWLALRYRWRAFVINLAGAPAPTLAVAAGFAAVGAEQGSVEFYAALAVATALTLTVNVAIVVPLMGLLDGRPILPSLATFAGLVPTAAISAALTLTVAAGYVEYGPPALGFALFVVTAVAYMGRLVTQSREQARQYANLSWGVLSALVRTLNERDHRAARHCAAVAMFSRDVARMAGLGERDQEVAHTAGLLHDIGKFVLSDRVMERGTPLNEIDWRGIRRHPDIGADLLRDIGVFGPIGEIIRCHHERIDGRGYPRGLTGEDIPEVAKIVAVAEVYDTLTAPDTYRTPMTSFEALTELRRVSGLQLEGGYVEVLSELLTGRGTDYRHQDEADFDRELDMERRISEAAAPS